MMNCLRNETGIDSAECVLRLADDTDKQDRQLNITNVFGCKNHGESMRPNTETSVRDERHKLNLRNEAKYRDFVSPIPIAEFDGKCTPVSLCSTTLCGTLFPSPSLVSERVLLPPTHYHGTRLRLFREKGTALYSLVDSRRILRTHARHYPQSSWFKIRSPMAGLKKGI